MNKTEEHSFESIWKEHVIKKLIGKTIPLGTRGTNYIVNVDMSGVWRTTSENKENFIPISTFEWCVNELFNKGTLERKEINIKFPKRLSSGTFAILKEIPLFEHTKQPRLTLIYKKKSGS